MLARTKNRSTICVNGYSVWLEDSSKSDGYRILQSFLKDPPNETVLDLYDENAPVAPGTVKKPVQVNPAENIAKEVMGFLKRLLEC